jgi:hypothetical protein
MPETDIFGLDDVDFFVVIGFIFCRPPKTFHATNIASANQGTTASMTDN